jgi:anti-sigma28 factor (negative regulator of flagellin synthesis)
MIRDYLGAEALFTIKTAVMVNKMPKTINHVMGSSNKNQAINAVVGGVKYIKLVTRVASPFRIITNKSEMAPIDKAKIAQIKEKINSGTH